MNDIQKVRAMLGMPFPEENKTTNKIDTVRQSRGTHVLLIAKCPDKKDVVLFESGRCEESNLLCDLAIRLLEERKKR